MGDASGCSDLIPNFCDSDRPNFVEDSNDIAIHGHRGCAERDFDVGISPVELIKLREDLVICDILVIEEDGVVLQHFYGDKILYPAWWRPNRSRQINPNTFHMCLAQAHHHKAGKQEEHDVDQRNDLDARSLMRNWRRHSHMKKLELILGA